MSGRHDIGAPFTLSDTAGRRVSLADFKGKLVLLYFGFATCPDVSQRTSRSSRRRCARSAPRVQPLFVTLDPERDSPAVLREYVAAFHPAFVALTGTEAQVRRVATSFKVFFEKVPLAGGGYTIDHTAYTFLWIDAENS